MFGFCTCTDASHNGTLTERQSHTCLPACPWGRRYSITPVPRAVFGLTTVSWNTGLPSNSFSLARGWLRTTNRRPWRRREVNDQINHQEYVGGEESTGRDKTGTANRLLSLEDLIPGSLFFRQNLWGDHGAGLWASPAQGSPRLYRQSLQVWIELTYQLPQL